VINEESDRLDRLVGEAAEVAQLESHEFQLDQERHRILELVQSAAAKLKQVLGKHPIEIRVPGDLVATLDGDRIEEVLIQLLENAAKYSHAEAPIRITAEKKDSSVIVSVAHQGMGIDDMEQQLIFDKFIAAKSALPHAGHGHGTGDCRYCTFLSTTGERTNGAGLADRSRGEGGPCLFSHLGWFFSPAGRVVSANFSCESFSTPTPVCDSNRRERSVRGEFAGSHRLRLVTPCDGSPQEDSQNNRNSCKRGCTGQEYDRHLFSTCSTKELIAKRPCTHRLPEFTSDFIQRKRLVDIIESTSLKTKI
jgi:hypothetical protein